VRSLRKTLREVGVAELQPLLEQTDTGIGDRQPQDGTGGTVS